MPYSDNEQKLDLERLRLASDLRQLARDTPNRDLKAHCLRMAKMWSVQAEPDPFGSISFPSALYH